MESAAQSLRNSITAIRKSFGLRIAKNRGLDDTIVNDLNTLTKALEDVNNKLDKHISDTAGPASVSSSPTRL